MFIYIFVLIFLYSSYVVECSYNYLLSYYVFDVDTFIVPIILVGRLEWICDMLLKVLYLIVIPWARVVCLIYTPEARGPQARGLRVYISGEPRVHMV